MVVWVGSGRRKAPALFSFSDEMGADVAAVRVAAVFPKVKSQPGAELEATITEGDGKIHTSKRGADVGGHVVGTLRSVNKKAVAVWDEPRKKSVKIAANVWVGIFLD